MTLLEAGKILADVGYFGGVVLAAILARPLLAALRDLATVGRAIVTVVSIRGDAEREAERVASAERREILDAVRDVKATVVARL